MILFQIAYSSVYKISSMTVYYGSRIESKQDVRKEYRKLRRMLKEKNFLRGIFKNLLKIGLN